MSDNQLAIRNNSMIRTMDDAERAAAAMSKSGYFQDAAQAAQAVVKILAGQELGFGPFASMTGIHIIQGRPAIGANLMAAAVKASGRYNYRVIEMTDETCELAFYEGKEKIGSSRFTMSDARKAGTKNLDKFPRNMLFSRAISNGVRWYCPDVFAGAPTYTPEELGADVNADGEVITVTPTVVQPAPAPAPAAPWAEPVATENDSAPMTLATALEYRTKKGTRFGDMDADQLATLSGWIAKAIRDNGKDPEHKADLLAQQAAIAVIVKARTEQD